MASESLRISSFVINGPFLTKLFGLGCHRLKFKAGTPGARIRVCSHPSSLCPLECPVTGWSFCRWVFSSVCSHFPPSSSGGPRAAGPGSCALSPDAHWEASQLETPVQLSKMMPGGRGCGETRDPPAQTCLLSDSDEHL